MTYEGDGLMPRELSKQFEKDEFLQEIVVLHEVNQVAPTIYGIELEQRMREYAALDDEYNVRAKNNTDGRETEFLEELARKLIKYEDYIERLRVQHDEERDRGGQGAPEKDSLINEPHPDSFAHPGNLTVN